MRRKDRAIPDSAESMALLAKADYCFLATCGGDSVPLITPVNHVVVGGVVYLHCAWEGHKIDNIRANPKVCVSAVPRARVDPERYTTYYESVVAFGNARIVTSNEERNHALRALCARFAPGREFAASCDSSETERTCVVAVDIDYITGKRNPDPLDWPERANCVR
ncbi:MAG: pyridoxamine 5'-phosphate oxidase family protein [Firmicutes bacterium]|jgi:nitroimidazol reductase NimA-like FMN-containing flavoprotein (pyridoxamine 5'-phosphate oxidase superfamily)|nr:pyridoxamine 5'-phosphate oxidase family protein [Bacillota bacterium]